jgi:hypothetical protein
LSWRKITRFMPLYLAFNNIQDVELCQILPKSQKLFLQRKQKKK